MVKRDPRFEAKIEKAAPFARPILKQLREAVRAGCPQAEEALKWGHPSFVHHGLLCGMAAFKAHCSFGFWKHKLLVERGGPKAAAELEALGRLTDVSQLPPKATLVRYVRLAAKLNEDGVKGPATRRARPKPPAKVPADLARALGGNTRAKVYFETLSPSHRREYIEWLTEAKQAQTRQRRLATALRWLADGKPRHWKYMRRS